MSPSPGYAPAPTKPTRILGPDLVPLTGDVSVTPGNAMAVTRFQNGLVVAGSPAVGLRSVPAFAPGAAVARTLQKMNVQSPVLTYLDIMLGTAPVGTDGSNHANVQVAGSGSGGPVVVPMTAGVSEYHLGLFDLTTPLARGVTNGGTDTTFTGSANAFPFQVSTNTLVRSVDYVAAPDSGADPAVDYVRCGIATGCANGTSILGANWLTDANGNRCFKDTLLGALWPTSRPLHTFPGTAGYLCSPGTTYFLVVVLVKGTTNLPHNSTKAGVDVNNGSGSYTASGNLTGRFGGNFTSLNNDNNYSSNVWNDAAVSFGQMGGASLYGAVLGVPMSGLVVVSQTITGAPPGTTGSDANIIASC